MALVSTIYSDPYRRFPIDAAANDVIHNPDGCPRLEGKTAYELREMIACNEVSPREVKEHLQGKATLKVPSRRLLRELLSAGHAVRGAASG